MVSSAKSTVSERSNESMAAKVRAARMAKRRIEGVLEKKMRLASMLNRRAFLRRFGSSRSMEATLDGMEMELNDFEKAIGREILGPAVPAETKNDDGKSPFSFDLAARTLGKSKKNTDELQATETNSDECENQEALSVQSKANQTHSSSMSQGNKSVTTRKVSNLVSRLPEVDDVDEASDNDSESSSVSDNEDDEESVEMAPQIDYQESNAEIKASSPFRFFDRLVREGDFCIDYACRVIECDPTEMYTNAHTAIADYTHLEGPGEIKPTEVEVVKERKAEEEETPKKRKSWFRGIPGLKKDAAIIELKNADPALDDLTDSDSWQSEGEDDISEIDDSKLLSSSPEEYFATIAARKKSLNRVGDQDGKENVGRIEHGGRVMCEV